MENLQEERKAFEALGLSYAFNDKVKVEHVMFAGVRNYWFTPDRIAGSEIIIYLHGGGFIYGSIQSHRAMVSHIAAATCRKILFVEYSLAPERPFPNALNETTDVIQAMLRETGVQFAIAGDSAGGNLAMSTTSNLKKLNLPAPLYQVLISPWVNVETTYASYYENEKHDPILTKDFVKYAAAHYTGNHNLSDPLISPVHGSFAGLNPTLILAGAKEILRDDSLHLHQALQNAGCTSVLKIFDDVTHVWILTDISSHNSKNALQAISNFIDSVTNQVC